MAGIVNDFQPNFKFSRLIFGGTPVPIGVCARYSLGQSLAHVKITGHSPLTAKIQSPENAHYGAHSRKCALRCAFKNGSGEAV